MFQHTAARRRLPLPAPLSVAKPSGFQHTAARRRLLQHSLLRLPTLSFNTQPPEGGCITADKLAIGVGGFQHTAARRRLR